jgi:type IV pilus assembly protein PilA
VITQALGRGEDSVRKQRGFSLIELLIVVAIILVIAAIAIPNMMRAKISANEASAVASIRTISTAETTYASTYPTVGYTCTLAELGPPASGTAVSASAAGILDDVLAAGQKAGYAFALQSCAGTPKANYTSTAVPLNYGGTGTRAFCSSTPGVIMFAPDGLSATCLASGTVIQ